MAADIRSAVDRALDEPASHTRDLGGAASTRACAAAVAANLRGPEAR
jgi:isocitrate/isopropylmalate dehydrogenase